MHPVTHPYPTRQSWKCAGCDQSVTEAMACDQCHTILCLPCASHNGNHLIPAGSRQGKICGLLLPSPDSITVESSAVGEPEAA
jgi:hypothetical protein